jgi:hypothetical protein
MKPRHPKLDWIKMVLADLEHRRDDPQNDAPTDELAVVSPEPAPVAASAGNSRARSRP